MEEICTPKSIAGSLSVRDMGKMELKETDCFGRRRGGKRYIGEGTDGWRTQKKRGWWKVKAGWVMGQVRKFFCIKIC